VRHSEETPVETALPTDTDSVSARRVVEAGSPTLSERVSTSRVGWLSINFSVFSEYESDLLINVFVKETRSVVLVDITV